MAGYLMAGYLKRWSDSLALWKQRHDLGSLQQF